MIKGVKTVHMSHGTDYKTASIPGSCSSQLSYQGSVIMSGFYASDKVSLFVHMCNYLRLFSWVKVVRFPRRGSFLPITFITFLTSSTTLEFTFSEGSNSQRMTMFYCTKFKM